MIAGLRRQATVTGFAHVLLANRTVHTDDGWHQVGDAGQPGFENGWRNYGQGYSPARYRLDASGFVHLDGVVANDAAPVDATIFTLPAGFRPRQQMDLPCAHNRLESYEMGSLLVHTDGRVVLDTHTAGAAYGYVLLGNHRWRAA